MKIVEFNVEDLLNDDSIEFCDSSSVLDDAFSSDRIDEMSLIEMSSNVATRATKEFTLNVKWDECTLDFVDSIVNHGISNPVAILNSMILDGHHRMAVAWKHNLPLPVQIFDSWEEFDEKHVWEKKGQITSYGEEIMEDF